MNIILFSTFAVYLYNYWCSSVPTKTVLSFSKLCDCSNMPPSSLALTKLDILDVFSEIKVGVGYKVDNEFIPHFPGEETNAHNVFHKYYTITCFRSLYGQRFVDI